MSDWLGLVVVIGIFLVMAGFSCTIELQKFFSYIKKPKGVIIGLSIQYGILPFTAFFISQMLNLSSLHSTAFIMTASCPGGTLSNFWCWFFASDLELSIAMTASSSLLSFIFLTFNCLLYMPLVSDTEVKIDYISLAISVSSLILGVIFGLMIGYKSKDNAANDTSISCKKMVIMMGSLSLIVTLLLGAYQNTLVSSVPAYLLPFEIFVAAVMLNMTSWTIAFLLSYFVCSMPHNQCITVCIECANQNVGLCIALILLTMHPADADIAVGVPMFYGVLNAVLIFIFGTLLRLCGFIENNDDELCHTFANSGFSKLCQFLNKHNSHHLHHDIHDTHSTSKSDSAGHNRKRTTKYRHRQLGSNSSMMQLKSTTPDTEHHLDDEDDDDDIQYNIGPTPSDEDVPLKKKTSHAKKPTNIHCNVNTAIFDREITVNTPLTEE